MTRTIGFAGKRGLVWSLLASFLVPAIMGGAYIALMVLSETGAAGMACMAAAFGFVLLLWWFFRMLTGKAAIARAAAVGDADRVLELADGQLARRWTARTRAPFQMYRALAFELRGEWSASLRELDRVPVDALSRPLRVVAACSRVAALAESDRFGEARAALDRDVTPLARKLDRRIDAAAVIAAALATGRTLVAEGRCEAALPVLQRVLDDVRTGASPRAVAHHYAARCADATGDASAAATHRASAAELAPTAWFVRRSP